MKFLVLIILLLYIASPIDAIPAVPIDDIAVTVGTAAYMLTPKKLIKTVFRYRVSVTAI